MPVLRVRPGEADSCADVSVFDTWAKDALTHGQEPVNAITVWIERQRLEYLSVDRLLNRSIRVAEVQSYRG